MYFKATTYDDAKLKFEELLDTLPQLPIYLLGNGANGKSYLIREFTDMIQKYDRLVYHENGPKEPHFLDIICILSDFQIKNPAHVIDMNNIFFSNVPSFSI